MSSSRQFDGKSPVSAWDQQQVAAYAREYGAALYRYFAKRGAAAENCEDLTQEVFARLVALKHRDNVSNGEAYLMRTAGSVWIDFLRKQQRRPDHSHAEFNDSDHSPEGISTERVLEGREALDAVLEALAAMPARTRQIYLLCRVDGLKRSVVATSLGISVSGVDKHLMIAAKALGLAIRS